MLYLNILNCFTCRIFIYNFGLLSLSTALFKYTHKCGATSNSPFTNTEYTHTYLVTPSTSPASFTNL